MKSIVLAGLVATATLLTGCASIVNGNNQVISVETIGREGKVMGANCELKNPKGTFYVTTPGTVTIRRAYDDLNVRCEKAGMEPGLAAVKSSTKAMAFGNLVFGGVIGAAVDAGSGAAYDYPTLITVMMGVTTSVQAPAAPQAAPQAAAPAPMQTQAPGPAQR